MNGLFAADPPSARCHPWRRVRLWGVTGAPMRPRMARICPGELAICYIRLVDEIDGLELILLIFGIPLLFAAWAALGYWLIGSSGDGLVFWIAAPFVLLIAVAQFKWLTSRRP